MCHYFHSTSSKNNFFENFYCCDPSPLNWVVIMGGGVIAVKFKMSYRRARVNIKSGMVAAFNTINFYPGLFLDRKEFLFKKHSCIVQLHMYQMPMSTYQASCF